MQQHVFTECVHFFVFFCLSWAALCLVVVSFCFFALLDSIVFSRGSKKSFFGALYKNSDDVAWVRTTSLHNERDVTSTFIFLWHVYIKCIISSRTDILVVVSSRTDPDDDVVVVGARRRCNKNTFWSMSSSSVIFIVVDGAGRS